jgi:hypothetical protein
VAEAAKLQKTEPDRKKNARAHQQDEHGDAPDSCVGRVKKVRECLHKKSFSDDDARPAAAMLLF